VPILRFYREDLSMLHTNSLVRRANVQLRTARPREQDGWRYTVREQRVTMDPRPSPERVLTYVFFRSFGCRYDRAGECTMCNYAVAERVDAASMVADVREALRTRGHYDALGISPFGNMFDVTEVPAQAREAIFAMAAETDASIFSCESRPETLSDEVIEHAVSTLNGKRLFINLGLEAANTWVQAHCVGKSLSNEGYRAATSSMRRHGAFPVTNVLLGAPFLTDEEAIESAVGTIRWALANGSHICVLFPCNVKGWTLQEWLWERQMYRVPSLWSLVEALRRLGPEATSAVALSWYATEPTDERRRAQVSDPLREAPTTCPLCRDRVLAGLDRFNAGGGYQVIEELCQIDCACREAWLRRLHDQASALPLSDRVLLAYDRIGSELFGDWWKRNQGKVRAELELGYDGSVSPESVSRGLGN
jgi:radical SAM enzyme (TIGR01210 family)